MISAWQKDQDLLDDIESSKGISEGFRLWWLGQSGFLLQWHGHHILIDPYLSDSLTHKYAQTDKPHIRMSEKVIDPCRLNFIDIVTSSHNHTDHCDGETLIPLLQQNPDLQIVAPKANVDFVSNRIGILPSDLYGISAGGKLELDSGITVYGIPAAHNEIAKNDEGDCLFMGFIFQFGKYTVYHSGDTLLKHEIIEALKPFSIDVALLPINGNKPERRVAGNLDAREAIQLAKTLSVQTVIPCHYHMFTFNTVEPDQFIEIAKNQLQSVRVLKGGEKLSYV